MVDISSANLSAAEKEKSVGFGTRNYENNKIKTKITVEHSVTKKIAIENSIFKIHTRSTPAKNHGNFRRKKKPTEKSFFFRGWF